MQPLNLEFAKFHQNLKDEYYHFVGQIDILALEFV